jgi:hypothetical protein
MLRRFPGGLAITIHRLAPAGQENPRQGARRENPRRRAATVNRVHVSIEHKQLPMVFMVLIRLEVNTPIIFIIFCRFL